MTRPVAFFPCHGRGPGRVTYDVAAAADAALVDRLRRGDRAAFRELYARFAQASFGFLLRLAGRRDAAEDLHQEVWLSIARHAARLAPDTDLAAWIFTGRTQPFRLVAQARDVAAPGPDAGTLDEIASGASPADDPGCRDLERALASLPEMHREMLLLVGVEGLDVDAGGGGARDPSRCRPPAAGARTRRARGGARRRGGRARGCTRQ